MEIEMENVYLYPQEPSKPIMNDLSQNWVNFDHFEVYFRIIQTSGIIIKLSVMIL